MSWMSWMRRMRRMRRMWLKRRMILLLPPPWRGRAGERGLYGYGTFTLADTNPLAASCTS